MSHELHQEPASIDDQTPVEENNSHSKSYFSRFRRVLVGNPRDLEDPSLYHHMSLIALLAWVGLGADGLSSSCYGPEEAFRTLGSHTYLAGFLALAMAFTVFIISRAYKLLIEHFPIGGGYVVATKLLGPFPGVISGCSLLVDYVLTISISVASGADALFSFLPTEWLPYKLPVEVAVILVLMVMNLRGVKESVTVLFPIFAIFVLTHTLVILWGLFANMNRFPELWTQTKTGLAEDTHSLGIFGLLWLFLKAYSMGGGTYTGIEAVSNGVNIMREPKIKTAQRTMTYMAGSLAFTAGGLLLCYMVMGLHPVEGQTMNAVLFDQLAGTIKLGSWNIGHWFVVISLISETFLLFVAAQAGLIDGPRVMANMALDNWMPRRFATLSDRLTMQDGVILMCGAALLTLFQTGGAVNKLVVMYSINVFLTFSLTEIAMCRFWFTHKDEPDRKKNLSVHGTGLALCLCILIVTVLQKFSEGGWLTLVATSGLILICCAIRLHYNRIGEEFRVLADNIGSLPPQNTKPVPSPDPKEQTAILLVGGYGGLGIHALLSIFRFFPGHFKNFHFISVGVLDSGNFKGQKEVENLRNACRESLCRYVTLANNFGFPATFSFEIGTDVAEEAECLCYAAARQYPNHMTFAGKLVFEHETWIQRLLHNETSNEIQRRLQFLGQPMVILPIRMMSKKPKAVFAPAQ